MFKGETTFDFTESTIFRLAHVITLTDIVGKGP
jgi:hypothetical protein